MDSCAAPSCLNLAEENAQEQTEGEGYECKEQRCLGDPNALVRSGPGSQVSEFFARLGSSECAEESCDHKAARPCKDCAIEIGAHIAAVCNPMHAVGEVVCDG